MTTKNEINGFNPFINLTRKSIITAFFAVIVLISVSVKAQYTTTHYIAPSPWSYFDQYNEIVVTTISSTPVTVSIKGSDGTVYSNSLTTVSGTPLRYRFSARDAVANLSGTVLTGMGLIVSASAPVGVQVRNIASDLYTISGGTPGDQTPCVQKGNTSFTSLGDQGLGTSFRVGYYANVTGTSCYSEAGAVIYSVMAINNGTNVYLNGTLLTTLNSGQAYLFTAKLGSLVTSSDNIVVNSGMRGDNSSGCGDGVQSQVIPAALLGTTYIVVRSNGNTGYERSTIIATTANTTVTVTVPSTGTTSTYTLVNAGDYVTINNGDGATAYTQSYITATKNVAVYSGTADGCEIDMIVQPPLNNCAGSFDVQTVSFLNNANASNSAFPYFGYIIIQSDTAKVYFNGTNLESIVGARTAIGTSGFYIIRYTNTQLGSPTNLHFVVNARINVALIESGAGYSMSAFITSISSVMPPPSVTSNCLPATLTAQGGFVSYQWYNSGVAITGATAQTYSPSTNGTYSVTGSTYSCGATPVSTAVLINPKPKAGIDQVICAGTTATLLGTSTVTNASWSAQSGNPTGYSLGSTNSGNSSVVFTNSATGNYNFIFDAGCTDTMTIKVKATSSSTTTITTCSNNPYTFNGTNYNTSGTYIAHLSNSVGCDSAATLILTVKPVSTSTKYITICSGSSYTFNGTAYTTTGTYTYHTTNSVGCDSAASLVLTVNFTSTSTTNVSICTGSTYTFNGTNYSVAGTYVAHLTNSVGCDSAATLILKVNSLSTSSTSASICAGSSYTFNGVAYTSSGTYVAHLSNSVGCDSAATLVLTVKVNTSSTTNATILTGNTYTFNGTTYSYPGTYTIHLTNIAGCDSVATLILTVNSLSSTTASICSGSSYTFNGTSYSTTGTYTAHLTNKLGGDSIATLYLTVKPLSTSTTNASICSGNSYTFNGTSYTTAGTYVVHLTNSVGCDSAATLVLTVKATSASTTSISICSGASYTFNSTIYSTAGTYVYHTTNKAGCDSAATLVLTVKPTSSSLTTATICSNTSYSFNSTAYNTSGTYTVHLTNSVGCDSAATLVLTVKATSSSSTTASICSGTSYIFNGTSYSTSGTYTYHTTNSVGCDSAAILVLTVNALPSVAAISGSASVCSNVSATYTNTTSGGVWSSSNSAISIINTSTGILTSTNAGTINVIYTVTSSAGCSTIASKSVTVNAAPAVNAITGTTTLCLGGTTTLSNTTYGGVWSSSNTSVATINSAGVVTPVSAGSTTISYTLTSGAGCSTFASTVVNVSAPTSSTTNASFCAGTLYSFNGNTYANAGTYLIHLTNAAGCDSAATLILTAKATSSSTTNISICPSALPYIWNGLTFNIAGTQTAHFTNAIGCDSAARLTLTVKLAAVSTTTASICPGSFYTFNGTSYNTAGTYTYHTTNAVGCDSAASLVLTIKATSTSSTNLSICPSALPYSWNGLTFNAAGTQTAHLTNAVGCDSAATLVLTVKATSTSTTNASICSGTSYTFNGASYSTAGTYTYHTTNAVGCDSAAVLVLTVKATSTSSSNLSICPSALPYTWNSLTFNAAGTQTAHLTNAVGCDSAATLVLTVKANSTSTTSVTACSSYTWNSSTYITSGTYTYSTINAKGCDSTATLNLTVNYPSTSTTNVTACSSYTWNGSIHTTSGTYTYSTINAKGCDSTATLNLTVNYPSTSSTNVTACSSYTWNGTAYATSGTYTYSTTNALGCDSTATLNLTVNYPSTTSTNVTACSSYTWNGTTYTTSGTYTYSTLNALGCDSTATLILTVNYPSTSSTSVTACSSYNWNGSTYTTSGTYIYSTTNAVGCDSTATLYLTVNYPSTSSTNVTACSSYTWNGSTYTTSGTYTYSSTNAVGCDSTATLYLTVNYPSTSSTNVTACSSYTWNGSTYTTSGTYTYSTTNAKGCDSTATLNLIVNYPSASSTNVTACSSYTWNGTTYTTSGTYIYSTTNAVGCDSTATLNLTVNYPSTSTSNVTACSSYTWNGTTYTTSGTYTYSTLNALGCDSTATLNLIINYPSTSSINVTACSSYLWNGTSYTTSGTYTYSTINALGCDSTATLNLTVNYPSTSTTNVTACSSYTWNGTTYTSSGTYAYSTTNALGCDSTATLNLIVNYPTTSSTNVTACSSYLWNGTIYTTSGTYTYSTLNALGCDSTATLNLTVNNPSISTTNVTACSTYLWNGNTYTTSGTYTYSITNALGCDSTATLNLIISQPTSSTTNASICSGSTYSFNGQSYNTTGTYLAFLTNANGCDSVATLNLIVKQPTSSTTNVSICDGTSFTFNGHAYSVPGTYVAFLTNAAGCDSVATLNLTISSVALPTLQAIGGTSAVCPGDSTVLTNSTIGGIWTVDSTSIATVDSITGLVKGLVQGTAVVSYTVGTLGTACSATVSVPFTVNCDAVASGATGGLESKGLGDAVAKRVYNAALSSTDNRIDYSRLTPVKTNNIIQVMGTTTPGTLTLSDVMPAKESIGAGFKSYDMSSHVTDLTSFTNAAEVKTFDYTVKNETKAVTFLTRTYNNIYAHTKTVCDRLKEAKMLDIQHVTVQGMNFIQYKLQQNDGKIEYAISFSAGVKQNDNKFTVQSIWLTRNYAIQDTMYNFQVWAVEPAMARNMVSNILTKLNGILPVNQTVDSIGVPTTYITDVTRTQNKLIMNIRNNSSATKGTISLTVRGNENMSTTSPMSVPVTLLPNAITPVIIDVNDTYESDISLLVDNNLQDMAYMNDGNWNYSLSNSNNKPIRFTISNDGIMPTADEFRLFRNVTIDANVPDYVSIYKMMKAGGLSRDLSEYNQLQFKATATGTGKLTIMIQKASVTNWNEQYTYTMQVNGDLKDYAVNLKDFTSSGSNDALKADDIVTVTFSFIGSGNNNHIIASLADVKFSKVTSTIPVATLVNNMTVYPNPAIDRFSVKFMSDKETKLNMQLVEMGSGKVILTKTVNAVVGENIVPVEINTYLSAAGHYVLMLGNETMRYTPFKMAIR